MTILFIKPEQVDENDIDMRARELLAEELQASGIEAPVTIWSDEDRAYLEGNDGDYQRLDEHFKQQYEQTTGHPSTTVYDKEMLDDALMNRYLVLVELCENALRDQTIQSTSIDSSSSNFYMETEDGWYGCISGACNGLYSEGDDVGPFEERDEVIETLQGDEDE